MEISQRDFVPFGDVITEVFVAFQAGPKGTCHAPHDDPGAPVHLHGDAAVGYGAAAGHAERPADEDVADLDVELAGEQGVEAGDRSPRQPPAPGRPPAGLRPAGGDVTY